jgi:hypothetical protein
MQSQREYTTQAHRVTGTPTQAKEKAHTNAPDTDIDSDKHRETGTQETNRERHIQHLQFSHPKSGQALHRL